MFSSSLPVIVLLLYHCSQFVMKLILSYRLSMISLFAMYKPGMCELKIDQAFFK